MAIGINNTSYYSLDFDFYPLNDLIKDSKLLLLDVKGEENEVNNIYQINDDIKEFIDSV